MKRNIIGGAFTLASLMLAGHALAEDGVVHFVGEIVDTTCEVTSDTADQIVPLGKVSKMHFQVQVVWRRHRSSVLSLKIARQRTLKQPFVLMVQKRTAATAT